MAAVVVLGAITPAILASSSPRQLQLAAPLLLLRGRVSVPPRHGAPPLPPRAQSQATKTHTQDELEKIAAEVVQFCWKYNAERLKNLPEVAGCQVKVRMDGDEPYVTDNSNYIIDLYFQDPIKDANAAAKAISALEGGVDHGFFEHGQRCDHCRL